MSASNWVHRAESALDRGRGQDLEYLPGRPPPLFDSVLMQAAIAPLLAALMWGAAIFFEGLRGSTIDPIAYGVRVIAYGLTVRSVVLGLRMGERWKAFWHHRAMGLVITDDGILLRLADRDVAIAREHLVDVVLEGSATDTRMPSRRWSRIFLVTDPESGSTHLIVPPVFDDSPAALAARLQRWAGLGQEKDAEGVERSFPPPPQDGREFYRRAARGEAPPSTTVIRHGFGWLRRAPYLPTLLFFAAVFGVLRADPEVRTQLTEAVDPLIGTLLALIVLAIPARWIWMNRRDVKPQLGLSMVLSPSELLIQTEKGLLRTRWSNLARVSVETKRAWSVLDGAHRAASLVLSRRGDPTVRYEEAFLGIPVELARSLVDAYRTGRIGQSSEPDRLAPRHEAYEAE